MIRIKFAFETWSYLFIGVKDLVVCIYVFYNYTTQHFVANVRKYVTLYAGAFLSVVICSMQPF